MMLSCEDTSGEVLCSHLRTTVSREARSCWITCVGLWVGRSIELDYERGGS